MLHINNIFIILIISLLTYIFYNEFVVNFIKGETILKINLKRKNKMDVAIFIALIMIYMYNNIESFSSPLTVYLLSGFLLLIIYIFYIRRPELIFKKDGFFHCSIFIIYKDIQKIKLSEDGILVIYLKKRSLFIEVVYFEDFKKMLDLFFEKTTF